MAMKRASLGVCACVVLWATGCADSKVAGLFLAQGAGPGGDRVVVGSLDAVAGSTQTTLTNLGLHAISSREGDAIRITSTTKTGASFTLVLTREPTKQGEQTRIKLEWSNGRDEAAGVNILSEVTAKAGH
jgi:hypothetical protein